jgi:hypothetical protein
VSGTGRQRLAGPLRSVVVAELLGRVAPEPTDDDAGGERTGEEHARAPPAERTQVVEQTVESAVLDRAGPPVDGVSRLVYVVAEHAGVVDAPLGECP